MGDDLIRHKIKNMILHVITHPMGDELLRHIYGYVVGCVLGTAPGFP